MFCDFVDSSHCASIVFADCIDHDANVLISSIYGTLSWLMEIHISYCHRLRCEFLPQCSLKCLFAPWVLLCLGTLFRYPCLLLVFQLLIVLCHGWNNVTLRCCLVWLPKPSLVIDASIPKTYNFRSGDAYLRGYICLENYKMPTTFVNWTPWFAQAIWC